MSKNKNLILLKDYVNEHILLEQFGELYGCSEGYGYNPFTKECYPIPSDMDPANYKSLAPPKVVKRKSTTGGGTGLPSIGDVKEVLVNVKRLAETPIESSKACGHCGTFSACLFWSAIFCIKTGRHYGWRRHRGRRGSGFGSGF